MGGLRTVRHGAVVVLAGREGDQSSAPTTIAALNDVPLSTVIQYHTIGYIDVCINIVQRPVGHSVQILRRTSFMLCLLTMQLLVGRFVHVLKYVLYM